jgi:hypothetical protein
MAEFKDLPPLSPERLAELVSMSSDDTDPFVRHWLTGEYQDPKLEDTYRIFHLRLWAPRVRLVLGPFVSISWFVFLHAGISKEVVSSSNRPSVPMDAHIWSHNLSLTPHRLMQRCQNHTRTMALAC